jgi:hypothetical protein
MEFKRDGLVLVDFGKRYVDDLHFVFSLHSASPLAAFHPALLPSTQAARITPRIASRIASRVFGTV